MNSELLPSWPSTKVWGAAVSRSLMLMAALLSGCGGPLENHPTTTRISDKVHFGDNAFEKHMYGDARDFYSEALVMLDELERFEEKSPEEDHAVMQWCYNSRAVITTKLRMATIGDDINDIDNLVHKVEP